MNNKLKMRLKKIPYIKQIWHGVQHVEDFFMQAKGYAVAEKLKEGLPANESYYDLYRIINKEKYRDFSEKAQFLALKEIRKKYGKEKIKIAFQASFLSTWIGDDLIRKFQEDANFAITAVVAWQNNSSKEKEIPPLMAHFAKMGINCVFADGTVHPGDFDIVFYTSPYLKSLANFTDRDIPLKTLVVHIPYGIYLAVLQEMQFNDFVHNIAWRNYSPIKFYSEIADRYCNIKSRGMLCSGYPKLDKLYEADCKDSAEWKIAGDPSKVKKIIFAPHHSIEDVPYYSTFDKNKDFMLAYAKAHADTTSWIFKPHPLLRVTSVCAGVFKSEAEFDAYMQQWAELPNARIEEGEYLPYFASSDAMILDSVSFMAEYLYVHKPILFLTRKEASLNDFGAMVKNVLYQADGDDHSAIASFIENVFSNDTMKETRDLFFSKHLDYVSDNGMTASEFIYKDITGSLLNKQEGDKEYET